MKKVLIISYFFPPRPGVASLRLGGLAKYLPDYGWEPVILTAKNPETPDPRYNVIEVDESDILVQWKKRFGFSAEKTFREQLGQTKEKDTYVDFFLKCAREILAYPDYQKGWYNNVIPVARKLLESKEYDAIISSAGPYTTHIIAHDLKKQYNIFWIADFRDLWTQNHYYPYSCIRKFFERKLEIRTISNADVLTTVSAPLAGQLCQLHNLPAYPILNGFDPDLLNQSEISSKKFSITYTGRIYRGKMDPEPFFQVIRKLINSKKMLLSDLEINFWGFFEPWLQELVEKYYLNKIVNINDNVSFHQSVDNQRSSQILLLITQNVQREEGLIGGKIFEYLASHRPILAIGYSKGGVKEILDKTQSGIAAESYEELENALMKYYYQYKTEGKVRYSGIETQIAQYNHKEMARKFACLLDHI